MTKAIIFPWGRRPRKYSAIWDWGEPIPALEDPHGNQLLATCNLSCTKSIPVQQGTNEGECADGGQKSSKETQRKINNKRKFFPLLTCRWLFEGQTTYPRLDRGISSHFSPSYWLSKQNCKLLLSLQHLLAQRYESQSDCRPITAIVGKAPFKDNWGQTLQRPFVSLGSITPCPQHCIHLSWL